MPNFEFKKDCVSEPIPNLALDSIVIVIHDRTQGFRPMVSSAVWGKAPAARKSFSKFRKDVQVDIIEFNVAVRTGLN